MQQSPRQVFNRKCNWTKGRLGAVSGTLRQIEYDLHRDATVDMQLARPSLNTIYNEIANLLELINHRRKVLLGVK